MIALTVSKQSSRPDCRFLLLGDLYYILNVLKVKDDFTDRELEILQEDTDAWADNWIAVNEREGCENYTYCIPSYATLSLFYGSGETYTGTQTKGGSTKIKQFRIGITIVQQRGVRRD
jgi:hypothetical protein